jgi:hypothetical protein
MQAVFRGSRCPLGRLFGRRGGLGRVDRGGETAVPTVGLNPGLLESRGWRCGLTFRSHLHPRPPPMSHLPARPPPRWRDASRAGKGPTSGARDIRERLGTARANERRNSRPGPHDTLPAIALNCPDAAASAGYLTAERHRFSRTVCIVVLMIGAAGHRWPRNARLKRILLPVPPFRF